MADRIKGITIEIGGDTTGLQTALKDTNKTISNTQSALKDVNKLLKLDPTNTELLTQKQNLLKQAISETKSKLTTLKDAEKQAQQQFKDGKISEEQYNALKREIIATQGSLKDLETQAKTSNAVLSKIAGTAQTVGKKATEIGRGMSKVSAGIVGIGAASIAAFNTVDAGYDAIAKGTGATGDALKDLQTSMDTVFANFPADAETVGVAIADINTRFGFTGEVLENCAQKFLKYAQVNNTDVSTAIANVSRYMEDASIDASNFGEVLDDLTAASQASGIGIDKLAENLTKYGAPMRALGFDTKESIAVFASWEKAGVNTEIAFSGMKKAISNWSAAGKDARVEFKSTLKEIAECPDIAAATTKAIEVFGAKAGPDLADAIQCGRFEYEDFLEILENSGDTVDRTFNDTLDAPDKFKMTMNEVKLAASDLGGSVLEVLTPALEKLSDIIKKVSEWFNGLSDEQKEMVVKIALVVAAIGPLLIIFGKVASGISAISSAISFLLANPVVLLIAAIVALVTLIAIKGDEIQGMLQKVDDFLQNIFAKDWTEVFGPVIGEVLNAFMANIKNIWDSIKNIFDGVIDFIRGVFTGDWERAWTGVKEIFGGIFDGLVAIAKAPINGIIGILNLAINGINALIDGLNSISFKVPDWVPYAGGKEFGINIGHIGDIPYLAKGGILSQGSAVVGEAGPELLTMSGSKAIVQPLTNNSTTANAGSTQINFNGNYRFNDQSDVDYFMNQAALKLRVTR